MISRIISALPSSVLSLRRAWPVVGLSLCLINAAHAAPTVVASVKPLQLIAAAITEGVAVPQLLMEGGHDPHHVTLRPSDRRRLDQADLVLWVGPVLEPGLEDVMMDLESEVITAQAAPDVTLLESEGATDPHLWLDTRNARHIASALVAALQKLDAGNAQRYATNLEAFTRALDKTDTDIAMALDSQRNTAWAASHQAFGYFVAQFGLQQPLTLTDSSNSAPGVRRVMQLRETIATQNIRCLLTETSENPAELDALLEGTMLHVVGADVLGTQLPSNANGYPDLMLALAKAVASCLEGAQQ